MRMRLAVVALAMSMVSTAVSAAPIVPAFTTFGPLPAATFGGSGIPNTSVAVSTAGTVTVGLSAAARGDNTTVTDNGTGTFFAAAGPDASTSPVAVAGYGTFNFNMYAVDTASTAGTTFLLRYDFDPGFATDSVNAGTVYIGSNFQDSWNLGMGFLDVPVSGVVMPPVYPSYNNMAVGWYEFTLEAYNPNMQLLAASAIRVQVGDPLQEQVPEPASMLLLSLGLLGAGIARKRRQ